jgi:hypothetical protein
MILSLLDPTEIWEMAVQSNSPMPNYTYHSQDVFVLSTHIIRQHHPTAVLACGVMLLLPDQLPPKSTAQTANS